MFYPQRGRDIWMKTLKGLRELSTLTTIRILHFIVNFAAVFSGKEIFSLFWNLLHLFFYRILGKETSAKIFFSSTATWKLFSSFQAHMWWNLFWKRLLDRLFSTSWIFLCDRCVFSVFGGVSLSIWCEIGIFWTFLGFLTFWTKSCPRPTTT